MLWSGPRHGALLCVLPLIFLARWNGAHACSLQEQLAAASKPAIKDSIVSVVLDNCTLGPSLSILQGARLLLLGNGSIPHDLDLALADQRISVPDGSVTIANATVVGARFTESLFVLTSLSASSVQLMGLEIQTDCYSLLTQSQLALDANAQVVLGQGFLYVSYFSGPGVSMVNVNITCPITDVFSPDRDRLVAKDWWTLYNAISLANFPQSSIPGASIPAAGTSNIIANSTAAVTSSLSALYGSIPTVIYLEQHISLTNWLRSILLTRNTSLRGEAGNRPMLDFANRKRVLLIFRNVTGGRIGMQNINIMNSVQLAGEYLPQARLLSMMVYPIWSIWFEPWNFYRVLRPIVAVNVTHVYPKQEYDFFEGVTFTIESPVTGSLTQSQLVYKAFFMSIKYDSSRSDENTLAYTRFDTAGISMTNFAIVRDVPPGVTFPHIMADVPGPLFQPNVNTSAIMFDSIVVYDAEQLLSAMHSLVTAPAWDSPIIMYIVGNISMAGIKHRWPTGGFLMPASVNITGLRPSEYPQFPVTVLDVAEIPRLFVAKGGNTTLTISYLTLVNLPTEAAAGIVWDQATSSSDTISLSLIDTQRKPIQLNTVTMVIPLEEYSRVVNQVTSSIQGGSLGNYSGAAAAEGSLTLVYIQLISTRAWRGSAVTMTWVPPAGFNVTYTNVLPPPPSWMQPEGSASGGHKLSGGAIAGIIVGSVAAGLLIVSGIAFMVFYKCKQKLLSAASQEAYCSDSHKDTGEHLNGSNGTNAATPTKPNRADKRRNELLADVQDLSISAGNGGEPGSNFSGNDSTKANVTSPTPADELHQVMQSVLSDLDDKHLVILDVLGQGGFGTVYKGSWKGLTVAIKTITFQDRVVGGNEKAQQTAIMEAAISTLLVHPNIVTTYSYDLKPLKVQHPGDDGGLRITNQAVSDWKLFIIQECCDAGSLRQAVLKRKFWDEALRQPRMDYILDAALELASGLQHLHSKNIIHGDLNPNNVLLKREASSTRGVVCKLCDFGLSIKMSADQSHISNMRRGTPFYTAPEVMKHGNMTKAADCYSFGVMLWELYHSQTCYKTQPTGFQQRELFPLFPRRCPANFSALAAACMAPEAALRPPFTDIILSLQVMHDLLPKGQLMGGDGLPVLS